MKRLVDNFKWYPLSFFGPSSICKSNFLRALINQKVFELYSFPSLDSFNTSVIVSSVNLCSFSFFFFSP